jgi:hypothetical protein
MLATTPQYHLSEPLHISARLLPAVHVADAVLSAEAHATDGSRAHFRFYLDVPGFEQWISADSLVTTVGRTWTHAVARALETLTDSLGTDEISATLLGDFPAELATWVTENALEFMVAAEDLREWLDEHRLV